MPDIMMCSGEGCRIKEQCYRHTAEPSPFRQSYFVTPPCKDKMGGTSCEYYTCNRKWEDKK